MTKVLEVIVLRRMTPVLTGSAGFPDPSQTAFQDSRCCKVPVILVAQWPFCQNLSRRKHQLNWTAWFLSKQMGTQRGQSLSHFAFIHLAALTLSMVSRPFLGVLSIQGNSTQGAVVYTRALHTLFFTSLLHSYILWRRRLSILVAFIAIERLWSPHLSMLLIITPR